MSDACTINNDSTGIHYINIMIVNDTSSRKYDATAWSDIY
jgi:hypothetical protein